MDSILQPKRFVVPDLVVSHFYITPGDTVVDIGAGNGYFLEALANAVGESGVVYACEIQKNLVDSLTTQAEKFTEGVIKPIWGDVENLQGTKIPDQVADRVILVNTLFMLQDKDTALLEIKRILQPGGKVFVIDWAESYAGLGPPEGMVISKDTTINLFEQSGFVLENDYESGDHHYGLAFRLA